MAEAKGVRVFFTGAVPASTGPFHEYQDATGWSFDEIYDGNLIILAGDLVIAEYVANQILGVKYLEVSQ